MKKIVLLLIISFIFCAEYEDVIYLKNGSIIYGTIIETKPNEYYKIQSDKNVFIYSVDEIEVIKKEIIEDEIIEDEIIEDKEDDKKSGWDKSKGVYLNDRNYSVNDITEEWYDTRKDTREKKSISDKTWSFGLGIGTSRVLSAMRFTKDFYKLNDNAALFTYFLGGIGLGYSYQQNYNANGLVWTASTGMELLLEDSYVDGSVEDGLYFVADISVAYQMRVKRSNFWSFGIILHNGLYSDMDGDCGWWYDCYTRDIRINPIIGWDIRF